MLFRSLHAQTRWTAGLTSTVDMDEVQHAVDVSSVPGAEEQLALALADLADCLLWQGDAAAALEPLDDDGCDRHEAAQARANGHRHEGEVEHRE